MSLAHQYQAEVQYIRYTYTYVSIRSMYILNPRYNKTTGWYTHRYLTFPHLGEGIGLSLLYTYLPAQLGTEYQRNIILMLWHYLEKNNGINLYDIHMSSIVIFAVSRVQQFRGCDMKAPTLLVPTYQVNVTHDFPPPNQGYYLQVPLNQFANHNTLLTRL